MKVYDLLKLFHVEQEITISANGCDKSYKGLIRMALFLGIKEIILLLLKQSRSYRLLYDIHRT